MRDFFRFRLSRYGYDVRRDFKRTLRRGGFRVYDPAKDAAQERANLKAIDMASDEVIAEIKRLKLNPFLPSQRQA